MNTRHGLSFWLERGWKRFKNRKKPIELSYSRVQTYRRCPWMYHLVYEEGMRLGPHAATSLGQSLHKALAAFLTPQNKERSLDRLFDIYDEVWVNAGFSSTQQTLDTYDKGRKFLEKFYWTDQTRTNQVVATEKEFMAPLDGHLFRGTLDRLDRSPDGSHEIVEYKTEAAHWNAHRIANDLQMTFYDLGGKEGLKLSSLRLKYCFLSSGEYVETRRNDDQRTEARDLLKKVAYQIRSEDYPPNSAYCGRCHFGSRCVYCPK